MSEPSRSEPSASLLHLLHDVHRDVGTLSFPFELEDSDHLRDLATRAATQVKSHLLPRLADDANPAVVVLGGSTGVGKSTLLNSLVGREVSAAGVLRPTTRRAVIAHHPSVHAVPLRDLADAVAGAAIPPGLVVLDAPDLDSLEASNRDMARRLLEAADLWIFVTSAARYGDQVPWANLVRAHRRGLQVAVVLNRVPPAARTTVRADLLTRLDRMGLGFAPLFLIADTSPHEGPLPPAAVRELRDWLVAVAGRHQARAIIRRTTAGAWTSLHDNLLELADGLTAQADAARVLRDATHDATRGPEEDMARAVAAGDCAVGAPTTRWLTLASTGGALAPLVQHERRARAGVRGRQRDRRTAAVGLLAEDVSAAITTLLSDAIRDASATIQRVWQESGAGHLLAGDELLTADDARERAARATATWRDGVGGLLDASGIQLSRRATDLLGPAGTLDLVIAGAAGIAGAAAAAGEVLGDAEICGRARDELVREVRLAVQGAARPYLTVLQALPSADLATRLRVRASELKGHVDAV